MSFDRQFDLFHTAGGLLDEPAREENDGSNEERSARARVEQFAQPGRLCARLDDNALVGFPVTHLQPGTIERDPCLAPARFRPGLRLHRKHARSSDDDVVEIETIANDVMKYFVPL